MPNQFQRPELPYVPVPLPNNNRYELTTTMNQPIDFIQLEGDVNYLLDSLNFTYAFASGIAAGILPGSSSPTNIDKFPVTDGAGTISWSKIISSHFSNSCIPTGALQDGCVTNGKLAAASILNGNIVAGAIQNNNITDNTLSFDKITNEDNTHFQLFFNTQDNGTLSGAKLQAGSLPAAAIADGSLPGTKITDNTLPAAKIVNNSLTRGQLAAVIQPLIGAIIPWGAPNGVAVPAGYLEANGQLINRVTYALLFAVYGITYGAGDGVNTFGMPDWRGRIIVGIDPASGQPTGGRIVNGTIAVGGNGGEEVHTLTTTEIPSHNHTYQSTIDNTALLANGSFGQRAQFGSVTNTSNTGGGLPHNNMPPYMLNRILIYAGV